jgi:uncharacterized small protein (DUF1192 family)
MSDDLLQIIKATFALDGNPTLGVAIHEIERLHAGLAEAKASQRGDDEEREKLHEKIADLRAEVERLTLALGDSENRYDRLHKWKWDKIDGAHVITDEQIDALWSELRCRCGDCWTDRGLHSPDCREDSMLEIGVGRCPECAGKGINVTKGAARVCPRCQGHKWIREERGDE